MIGCGHDECFTRGRCCTRILQPWHAWAANGMMGFHPQHNLCSCRSPPPQVGVFASRGPSLSVVEYSELDPAVASAADPEASDGTLMYNWGNICMHYFSTKWLLKVVINTCHSIGLSAYLMPRASAGSR